MSTLPIHPTDGPIHTAFGLTYANYLTLPRTLLQSMPITWQERFVACLDEMHAAFAHVEQAEAYEITAGTEHLVEELSDAQMRQLGISEERKHGESTFYSRAGDELDGCYRVVLPTGDPVPHYNRGRTYIEPAAEYLASAGGPARPRDDAEILAAISAKVDQLPLLDDESKASDYDLGRHDLAESVRNLISRPKPAGRT